MKKFYKILPVLAAAFVAETRAQVTYAEHIAPLIYTHCTSCHRSGEIGGFPLTNYQEVSAWGTTIAYVTGIRYMPPWSPDASYSHLLGENRLTDAEIQQIDDWVQDGMPRGNVALEPTPPNFPTGSQLGTPDLVLSFAQSYRHQAGADMYQVFALPTGLTQNQQLSAIELRPGNSSIVHHALFSWDTSGTARANDAATPEYGYMNFSDFGVSGAEMRQFPSFAPGQKPRHYPDGIGQLLPANSDLLIQMHYAPTPVDAYDSSTVNLFFADAPVTRQVTQYILLPNNLTNGPFVIPANQVTTFHGQITVPFDVTLLAVGPHMHLLGKAWEVFVVDPQGDTTNLIKINDWDFHWQGIYSFPRFIKLSRNSVLHAYATYDNTTANPNNPNSPPAQVTWGEETTAEMYYLSLWFIPYRAGDENVVLPNDTIQLGPPLISSSEHIQLPQNRLYPIYPNPTANVLNVAFALVENQRLSIDIIDINGRVVKNIANNQTYSIGRHLQPIATDNLANGMYLLRITGQNFNQSQKFLISR